MRSGSIEAAGSVAVGGLAIAAGGTGGTLKSLFVKPFSILCQNRFYEFATFLPPPLLSNVKKTAQLVQFAAASLTWRWRRRLTDV